MKTRSYLKHAALMVLADFVDVWFSLKLAGRYSFRSERRASDGRVYRHDNVPHRRWRSVATFPRHFHDGSEGGLSASHLSQVPEKVLRQFLAFVRSKRVSASTLALPFFSDMSEKQVSAVCDILQEAIVQVRE